MSNIPPVLNNKEPVLKNLMIAIKFLKGAKPQEISLMCWHRETPCGTLYCAGGWLASQKYFQDQGLYLRQVDECDVKHLTLYYGALKVSSHDWDSDILDPLFGPGALDLFAPRGTSIMDKIHLGYKDVAGKLVPINHTSLTAVDDRQLAIRRFEWAYKREQQRLKEAEGVTA